MKFSKDSFKKNYGRLYLSRIRCTLFADVIAILVIILLLTAGITLPPSIAIILVGVIGLSLFPFLPLFFSYYIKALKMSERQKQWFDQGNLHVLLVLEDGFTWGAITTHTKEFIVKKVTNVSVNDRYIEVFGDIELIEKYNESTDTKSVTICKIPRNFTNESKILNIGGISNAN